MKVVLTLGFYDDLDFDQKKKKKKRNSFPGFMNSLISALIGGLIVVLLLPTILNTGLININPNQSTNNNNSSIPPINGNNLSQISVNVNSGIVQAVEKVKPAVVGVINIQKQASFWTRETKDAVAAEGSGVVFEKRNGKAYIVTNHHVIKNASSVEVALANGDRVPAKLLGSDELTDLAVISIDAKYANAVAKLGESTNLKPGEPAIAIGNPLGTEFSQTVTVGVISSNNRSITKDLNNDGKTDYETEVIQTDAAINPGNSGGALVDIAGEVIGINSAKIAETGVEGLGFAIPISNAKPIIDQLIENGKVKRAYMGIGPYDVQNVSQEGRIQLKLPNEVNGGVVLVSVEDFGPAAIAGLKQYDVIVKLDDQQIKNSADLRNYLYHNKQVGDKMKVTFYRDGKVKTLTMTLSDFPNENK